MPSIKDLKKRIGSVKNTQQTTKAMKMVSAAKLRRAQEAILSNRPYAKQVQSLVGSLLASPEVTLRSPFLTAESSSEGQTQKKLHLVIVTSDRGLCAGFNSGVIKSAIRWIAEHKSNYSSITMSFVGKRGFDFFRSKKNLVVGRYFEELGGKVTFKKANDLSQALVQGFLEGEFDEVKLVYNEFKNAVQQTPVVENFLPLASESLEKGQTGEQSASMVIVKPSADAVLDSLLKKHFAIQVFRIMLESQAGEHGARMSAMENATKNAGEMIRKLTLQYNKQRQAGITKELLEIIAGSESAKSQA